MFNINYRDFGTHITFHTVVDDQELITHTTAFPTDDDRRVESINDRDSIWFVPRADWEVFKRSIQFHSEERFNAEQTRLSEPS
jgi:hypothetical protein